MNARRLSRRQGVTLMRFTISPAFVTALASKSDTLTQRELATQAGLAPVEFSRFLHGSPFGHITRLRIIAIGKRLGLNAHECTRPYDDPVFPEETDHVIS
jgi:transcriptional regulator with XRE-family HTH domain